MELNDCASAIVEMQGVMFLSLRIPCCTKQIDGCRDSSHANPARFAYVGDSEKCDSAFLEDLRDFFETVAVGACLDDRHDRATGRLAGNFYVMP